jgi:membrane protease YdiL (CAAX protease family)
MLTLFDHALAVVLAVVFPIRASVLGFGRLKRAAPDDVPRVRMGVYRGAMITQWTLAAATVALWIFTGRAWRVLGLIPVLGGGLIGVSVGLVLVVIVVLRQQMSGARDEQAVSALRRRMEHLERMLPHTPRDLRWFYALSFTAGVCEEFLYRGYMIWYLQKLGLALIPAALVSCVIFGLGHLYQGPRGILLTGVAGAFLAAVYLLSQSLYAGMAFHFLMDAYSGRTMYGVYRDQAGAPPGTMGTSA